MVTQAPTAVAAAAQNATQTDAVVSDLRKLLGGSGQLKTTRSSVRPNYQNPKPGSAPAIAGYIATNVVEVTLDDLTRVSGVIDHAMQSGANNIQRLQYQLKNPGLVHAQALREAAEQARMSAEAIAAGLKLKVLRVLSAEEVVPEEPLVMYKKAPPVPGSGTVPDTPLEVGTVEVTATVILRVEIEQ